MIIRSIQMAAIAAMLVAGAASAQDTIQAVPRAGVAFNSSVTVRAKIESIDIETRTVAFTLSSNGRLLDLAMADSVRDLNAIPDDAMVDITYTQVVTLLNLRQKGPGAHAARKEASNPNATDNEAGRMTMTVVAVDLAANKVSVIDGRGGAVQTFAATSIAKQDMLKKIKVGDVVIGLTTPLLVTAITPVK
jgi:hypothetical protein